MTMEDCSVITQCSNVMNLSVVDTDLHIHYGKVSDYAICVILDITH